MEAVKDWALTVCMACLCVGVLQQFTQNRSNFSVIKLILTLYILITAFAPLGNNNLLVYNFTYETVQAADAEIDTQSIIMQTTVQNLTQTVYQGIVQSDNTAEDVIINAEHSGEYINIISVQIITTPSTDVEKAKQSVKQILSEDVSIEIISGG